MAKKMLLAVTDESLRNSMSRCAEDGGYEFSSPNTPEELVAMAQRENYDAYLGDINFQRPDTALIEHFYQVWLLAKERVKRGEAKFLTFTSNSEAIAKGTRLGIPVVSKFARDSSERLDALFYS